MNFVESPSKEILFLEESSTDEVLYIMQDAQAWLQDSGGTFHVTPNIEWFSDYSVRAKRTGRLGNGPKCIIARISEVAIQLSNENTIILHQV